MSRLVCITAFALLLAPASLRAQQASPAAEAEYKQTIQEGLEEFGAGNFLEARSLFQRAHAVHPNARTLRALGTVEFELRNYVKAQEFLEGSLPIARSSGQASS